MSVAVIIGTTDPDLTTTGALKLELDIEAASTADDDSLSAQIRRVSRDAEAVVRYPLSAQSYVETVPGSGLRELMLSNSPIRAVTAVYGATSTDDVVDSTSYSVDADRGFLVRADGWFAERYRIDYVAGYTYSGLSTGSPLWSTQHGTTSTGRTLPEDIEGAVIQQVVNLASGSEDILSQRRIDELEVRYPSPRTRDAAFVDALAAHRRIV